MVEFECHRDADAAVGGEVGEQDGPKEHQSPDGAPSATSCEVVAPEVYGCMASLFMLRPSSCPRFHESYRTGFLDTVLPYAAVYGSYYASRNAARLRKPFLSDTHCSM